MKKWIVSVFSKKDNSLIYKKLKSTCNGIKIFKINNGECYCKNKIGKFEKFEPKLMSIILNDNFDKIIINTILRCFPLVTNKKDINKYILHKGKLESVIKSLNYKISYSQSEWDIFDYVSTILFKITKSHVFIDGNKRTALATSIQLLNMFGYYLKWESNPKIWKEFMIKIASFNKLNKQSEEKFIRNFIKKKFVDSTWINAKSII